MVTTKLTWGQRLNRHLLIIGLALGVLAAVAAGTVHAQNLDEGKSATRMFADNCATCHRGVAIPKLLPDVLTETATKSGTAAAVQQYRDLRAKYYGGQSYDFSEAALVAVATPLINANKPDDAMTWLQLNAEFFPKSSATYAALGQAYAKKNDTTSAIKNYEKAIELDPNNQIAKRQLEQLKK